MYLLNPIEVIKWFTKGNSASGGTWATGIWRTLYNEIAMFAPKKPPDELSFCLFLLNSTVSICFNPQNALLTVCAHTRAKYMIYIARGSSSISCVQSYMPHKYVWNLHSSMITITAVANFLTLYVSLEHFWYENLVPRRKFSSWWDLSYRHLTDSCQWNRHICGQSNARMNFLISNSYFNALY